MTLNTYQPPLRSAALWSLGLEHGAVSPATLAVFAGVDEIRARAYASILIAQGVAMDTPEGLVRGPKWETWAGQTSRSRPPRAACSAADEMASMQRNVWLRLRAACCQRSWSPSDLSKASGVASYAVARVLANGKPPLTAVALVLVARCLGTTAEDLMTIPPGDGSARCSVRGFAHAG